MSHYDYDKMNLVPKMCIVESRNECNTRIEFGKHSFKLPVVPANMECVINETLAIQLAKNGYFYVMHRFNVDTLKFCRTMISHKVYTSISLGVNADAYHIVDTLRIHNIIPDYITIDIAHGHSIKMEAMIKYIRVNLPDSFIIAGNVSTPEAVVDLEMWGANAIKVGIGPGSACTTYNATGFGSRGAQASILSICSSAAKTAKIIADGGISHHGDIAKSIVLGASMVMIGGMFSGLSDSPGSVVKGVDGITYKEFWGSASSFQSNKKNRIEGTKKLLSMKSHTMLEEMKHIEESLQSAISYGGGNKLACLCDVDYIVRG